MTLGYIICALLFASIMAFIAWCFFTAEEGWQDDAGYHAGTPPKGGE